MQLAVEPLPGRCTRWDRIEWHAGELFPRVGFIVTNLNKHSKNAVKWTKLSCRTFKDNQTRLQLFTLAYNLGNFLRRLAPCRNQCAIGR